MKNECGVYMFTFSNGKRCVGQTSVSLKKGYALSKCYNPRSVMSFVVLEVAQ